MSKNDVARQAHRYIKVSLYTSGYGIAVTVKKLPLCQSAFVIEGST